MSSFVSTFISAKALISSAPLIVSGLIFSKANFNKLLKFSSRLFGQFMDKIIFESVCSIKHIGIVNSSGFDSSAFLKFFLLLSDKSKYFINSQSVPSEV